MNDQLRTVAIRAIANEILNFKGQRDVENFLAVGDLETAETYVLGGIETCIEDKIVDDDVVRAMYDKLGVSQEKVLQLRARHNGGTVA